MKIALAQINPTVGDLNGNSRKIIDFARRARQQGADLAVFPELCVTGYPPQDLLEHPAFVEATQEALAEVARKVPQEMGVVLGAPVPNESTPGKPLFNAALLYEGGERKAEVHKKLLPTYDIFDEHRYFEPADSCEVVTWRGKRLGLHICEDMWNGEEQAAHHLYEENPISELAAQDVDLFVNISASPFSVGKHRHRMKLMEGICRQHGKPFAFANAVGANTDIIFDGDSRVHAGDGTLLHCAPSFEEHLLLWNVEQDAEACRIAHHESKDLYEALLLGIRDYFDKTNIFEKAVVGLSGGVDSAVTCALAVHALGPDKVVGVTMPSRYSSSGSVEDSKALADSLGIAFHNLPIEPAVDAFDAMLEDVFAGTEEDVTEENIQARARGLTLMALSNKFGYILLSTGNKSEAAVGYATLYGDMTGGLAVLSDVLKTRVYKLARYINEVGEDVVIPINTIEKPPSAELSPGQEDSDTLPPYDVLDEVLRRYIEEQQALKQIVEETGFESDLVHRVLDMVDRNEYKRRQAPPGLRVSGKAFGVGRRMPIVMRWERKEVERIAEESSLT